MRTPLFDKDIATCVGCGCDDDNACFGGCSWLRVDYDAGKGVCSQCRDHLKAFDADAHAPGRTTAAGR